MVNEQVTTIELSAGTPEEVKFSLAYPFYWINNMSSGDVYASLITPEADKDGTYTVAAGSQLRISGGAFSDNLTLLGEGKVQVVASGIASCPFKSAQGGGGIKYINGIAAVNGELALTQSLIPSDGTAYQFPYYIQSGTVTVDRNSKNGVSITFPVTFKSEPIVLFSATYNKSSINYPISANYNDLSNEGFTLVSWGIGGSSGISEAMCNGVVRWVAMGIIDI